VQRGERNHLIILGTGLLLVALLLLGGVHHHDDHEDCWYCAAAAAVAVPITLLAIAQLPRYSAPHADEAQIPSWFVWVTHHHRGPPAAH
jgi:hypothetical protein